MGAAACSVGAENFEMRIITQEIKKNHTYYEPIIAVHNPSCEAAKYSQGNKALLFGSSGM
jgi:hypothetical protein